MTQARRPGGTGLPGPWLPGLRVGPRRRRNRQIWPRRAPPPPARTPAAAPRPPPVTHRGGGSSSPALRRGAGDPPAGRPRNLGGSRSRPISFGPCTPRPAAREVRKEGDGAESRGHCSLPHLPSEAARAATLPAHTRQRSAGGNWVLSRHGGLRGMWGAGRPQILPTSSMCSVTSWEPLVGSCPCIITPPTWA